MDEIVKFCLELVISLLGDGRSAYELIFCQAGLLKPTACSGPNGCRNPIANAWYSHKIGTNGDGFEGWGLCNRGCSLAAQSLLVYLR